MNTQLFGVLVLIGATAGFSSGCAAHAQASGAANAEAPVVFVGTPTLVAVDSGVWVVRDSERATYYVEDCYWVYRDGSWYRSRAYDGGWLVVEASVVPTTIASRDHAAYVHYQGDATAQTRPAPRGEATASAQANDTPPATGNPHGGPPGHDEVPGIGNQRKAEAEQPGHASHGAPAKTDAARGSDDAPGHNEAPSAANPPKKAEAAPAAHGVPPNAKKNDKNDGKKK